MFRLPTRVVVEPGCRRSIGGELRALGATRVLLVCDRGLASTVWPSDIARGIAASGARVTRFDEVEINPRHDTVDRLAELARREGTDVVVGLGGGSVLDAAKAAAMLATNDGGVVEFEGADRFARDPLPFVAIPTTCGTGSEVTWVSVVTHAGRGRKLSVKGVGMFPTLALVDADVLATLPAPLVATTAMDALTHAVEAYTCRRANPVSDALAEKAVALILEHLFGATADIGEDALARAQIMRASTLAGMAFGNADVAGVHCLSESIGGLLDLPHGLLNATLLAPVLRHHGAAVADRLGVLASVAGVPGMGEVAVADRADAFLRAIESLGERIGIPSFASLGIDPGDFPRIAERAVTNGSNVSNPTPMSAQSYRTVLEAAAR